MSQSTTSPATNSGSAKQRSKAPSRRASSPYISIAETRALLADSFAARQARLDSDEMVTTDQAAALVGTNRVTINSWISKGRAIGLTQTKRGLKLPKWQFEQRVWDVLPELSRVLGTNEGWALLSFLETPHGAFQGASPLLMIERGQSKRVLEVAAGED